MAPNTSTSNATSNTSSDTTSNNNVSELQNHPVFNSIKNALAKLEAKKNKKKPERRQSAKSSVIKNVRCTIYPKRNPLRPKAQKEEPSASVSKVEPWTCHSQRENVPWPTSMPRIQVDRTSDRPQYSLKGMITKTHALLDPRINRKPWEKRILVDSPIEIPLEYSGGDGVVYNHDYRNMKPSEFKIPKPRHPIMTPHQLFAVRQR